MTIRGWESRYREIRNAFGYSKLKDLESAQKLNRKIRKKYPISRLKKLISGQTVFIIGAGPSLSNSILTLKKYENVTKIVADGAVRGLLERNIKPDILITDLDGDIDSIMKIGRTEIPIIVHAHGDNSNRLEIVKKLVLINIQPHVDDVLEYKDEWARCWVDLGTSDAIALDVLVNTLCQINGDIVRLKELCIGGVNEDWDVVDHPDSIFEATE